MHFVAPLVFNLLNRHFPPNKPRFHYIEDAERNVIYSLAKATQYW